MKISLLELAEITLVHWSKSSEMDLSEKGPSRDIQESSPCFHLLGQYPLSSSWPRPPPGPFPHFVVTGPPEGEVGGEASLARGMDCCQAKLPGFSVVSGVAWRPRERTRGRLA